MFSTAGNASDCVLRDVNNAGAVVGIDASVGFSQAFVWPAGVRTTLPQQLDFLGCRQSKALGHPRRPSGRMPSC